jgi:hypothetical protein
VEASVALLPKGSWRQSELLAAVEGAQIKTFGWPIGIVLTKDPWRPQPTAEGVRAQVAISEGEAATGRASYDYWYLRQTGDFYLLQSLFEDERQPQSLFFDTRIVRTTELLLFLARCYARLDVPDTTQLHIELRFGGLRGRQLRPASSNRFMPQARTTQEDLVISAVDCAVGELQTQLVSLVRDLVEPLFMVFDFFEVGEPALDEIINNFVAGKIS